MISAQEVQKHESILIESVENEFFVHIWHAMTHYISFIAALSPDRLQVVKRFQKAMQRHGLRKRDKHILFYCNRDGLFRRDVISAIHSKRIQTAASREHEPEEQRKSHFYK